MISVQHFYQDQEWSDKLPANKPKCNVEIWANHRPQVSSEPLLSWNNKISLSDEIVHHTYLDVQN